MTQLGFNTVLTCDYSVPTFCAKPAALMFSTIHNHPFVDGNKRADIVSGGAVLALYGWELTASNADLFAFTMRVVEDRLDVDEVTAWLEAHSRPASEQR